LGKNKDLTLFAPPPKYFKQTLELSDMKFNFGDLTKNDYPVKFDVAGRIKRKDNDDIKKLNKPDDNVIKALE